MKEHGLIFSSEMIRAFLEHRKSMTRRTRGLESFNQNPDDWELVGALKLNYSKIWVFQSKNDRSVSYKVSPYAVGDRVWVKETIGRGRLPNILTGEPTEIVTAIYLADNEPVLEEMRFDVSPWWKGKILSAIFMPKEAARIRCTITAIRCERLQSITDTDVVAEGFHAYTFARGCCSQNPPDHRWAFIDLWDRLNKKQPWSKNDWVWVLSLKEVERCPAIT